MRFKTKITSKYKILAISKDAISWLKKFFDDTDMDLYYESKRKVDLAIIEELKQFVPKSPVVVFRGMYWPSPDDYKEASNKLTKDIPSSGDKITYKDDMFSSWSDKYEAAHGYAKGADPEGLHIVVRMTASPKDILVDSDMIPEDIMKNFRYKTGDMKESRELVIKPNNYKVEVISVDWTDEEGIWQDDSLEGF